VRSRLEKHPEANSETHQHAAASATLPMRTSELSGASTVKHWQQWSTDLTHQLGAEGDPLE